MANIARATPSVVRYAARAFALGVNGSQAAASVLTDMIFGGIPPASVVSSAPLHLGGSGTLQATVTEASSKGLPLGGAATARVSLGLSSSARIPLGSIAEVLLALPLVTIQRLPLGGAATVTAPLAASSNARLPLGSDAELDVPVVMDTSAALPLGSVAELRVLAQLVSNARFPLGGSGDLTAITFVRSNARLPMGSSGSAVVLVMVSSSAKLPLGGVSRLRSLGGNTATAEFYNTTKWLRPDAVVFDHLQAFTMGPVRIQDITQGILSYAWRVRHDPETLSLYYSRENDARDGWEDETLLFTYSGEPIAEIDCAFDQQGRILVCGDRGGEVWIYFYDPTIPGFSFENFGTGRQPKSILDNPEFTAESDILVFYSNDENDKICYRQQRDRYAIEYETEVTNVVGKYTEDATRTRGLRIQVYYSQRNFVTGRYAMKVLLSTLYPYRAPAEGLTPEVSFLADGVLLTIIQDAGLLEGLAPDVELHDSTFFNPFIDAGWEDEGLALEHEMLEDSELLQVVFDYLLYDEEGLELGHEWLEDSELVTVVLVYMLYDVEGLAPNVAFNSGGTLAP